MAKPELYDVHQRFMELAQQISDAYGIQVTEVDFKWMDISEVGTSRAMVSEVRTIANSKRA